MEPGDCFTIEVSTTFTELGCTIHREHERIIHPGYDEQSGKISLNTSTVIRHEYCATLRRCVVLTWLCRRGMVIRSGLQRAYATSYHILPLDHGRSIQTFPESLPYPGEKGYRAPCDMMR